MKTAIKIFTVIIFLMFSFDVFSQSIQKNSNDTSTLKVIRKTYKIGDTIIKPVYSNKIKSQITYDTIIITKNDTAIIGKKGLNIESVKKNK
ncbi:MAG: hypothetical protein V1904_05005 [Bacteroidota bacterium]